MSETERAILLNTLTDGPAPAERWKRAGTMAFIGWAQLTGLFLLLWAGVAVVVQKTLHVDVGFHSHAASATIISGVVVSALAAGVSAIVWLSKGRDLRPAITADIADGHVSEEFYEFTAAKRFQENEHGGLIYFLRTSEGKVLVLYDYDSQDLGVQGRDPLSSDFQPATELVIVRAPKSGIVINQQFSGTPLDAGEPKVLAVSPAVWPESEAYCDIPWDELEKHFSRK